MELDEALVRQQLAARGVPADSIPDEVLRQVLRDFKELDVGEDGAAPLSYPTALDDAEAVAGWTTAPLGALNCLLELDLGRRPFMVCLGPMFYIF